MSSSRSSTGEINVSGMSTADSESTYDERSRVLPERCRNRNSITLVVLVIFIRNLNSNYYELKDLLLTKNDIKYMLYTSY